MELVRTKMQSEHVAFAELMSAVRSMVQVCYLFYFTPLDVLSICVRRSEYVAVLFLELCALYSFTRTERVRVHETCKFYVI